MKSTSSLVALAATLLLHVAAITAAVVGLSGNENKHTEPLPIPIALLPPPQSAAVEDTLPLPNTAPLPPPPTAPAAPPEKKRPPKREPKPVNKPKPIPKPDKAVATRTKTPDAPIEPNPVASDPSPVAQAPALTQTAPATSTAQPAPPARTAVSISATYAATNRKPDYPALSRRYEEQGTVVLRIFVKADGTAGAVEIKSSSGYPLLDNSAKSTVQTWRFNPATSDGKPIAEWYQVSIPFKLQN